MSTRPSSFAINCNYLALDRDGKLITSNGRSPSFVINQLEMLRLEFASISQRKTPTIYIKFMDVQKPKGALTETVFFCSMFFFGFFFLFRYLILTVFEQVLFFYSDNRITIFHPKFLCIPSVFLSEVFFFFLSPLKLLFNLFRGKLVEGIASLRIFSLYLKLQKNDEAVYSIVTFVPFLREEKKGRAGGA